MRGLPVVVLLCASLVLVALPITNAKPRLSADYEFNCYGISDGTICAGITYDSGIPRWADIYLSTSEGYASAYWQYGMGATVTYLGAYDDNGNGSTGRLPTQIEPAPQPPESLDCQTCINLQTRLCYDIWDSEYREAGGQGAGIATSCLGLYEVPPAMLLCMGAGLIVGFAGQRSATKRLNACLINGWRSCVDDQGRSCYQ